MTGSGVTVGARAQWLCVALVAFLLAVGFAGVAQQRVGPGDAHVAMGTGPVLPASGDDDTMKHPGGGIPDSVRGASASSYHPLDAATTPDLPFASGHRSRTGVTRSAADSADYSDFCGARGPPAVS